MFKVMKSPAAYNIVSGLSRNLTVQWNCALMRIIHTDELSLIMDAVGNAEHYASQLRDSGVISESQKGRMVQMANVITANKVQRLASKMWTR